MDDLKHMVTGPIELFGTFIAEVRSILAEESLIPSSALEKFQRTLDRFSQDTENLLRTFRQKVIDKEAELQAVLYPVRYDLTGQARVALRQLSQTVGRFSLRRKLARPGAQTGDTLLAEYREALARGDTHTLEIFEAEAHGILDRKMEDLAEQGLTALQELSRVISRMALKEKLTRTWEEQTATALLAGYQEALAEGDIDKVELFEAEAERFLTRKGDLQALAKFVALKAQPLESRLTPAQREAKAALQELNRIKEEAALGMCLLASVSKFHAGLVPMCTQWRREVRHPVDEEAQRGISIGLHTDADPPLPAILVEWSNGGLRVQCREMFPPGRTLGLSMQFPRLQEQALSFKAEVRWFQEESNQPGRYLLGLRIVRGVEIPWGELFPQLMEQLAARGVL